MQPNNPIVPSAHYVLGFMFDSDSQHVALIKKLRPVRFAGKLNGIGGKIEVGETPGEAMVREFEEEAGMPTFRDRWSFFATRNGTEEDGSTFVVYIFATIGDLTQLRSVTDEPVASYPVSELPALCDSKRGVPDLAWTALLAQAHLRDGKPRHTESEGA